VTVIVTPSTAKAEARIVLIEAGLLRYVTKCAVAIVVHQEIWRAVFCVVVGHWITVLVRALVVRIQTKVDVQPAFAVVASERGSGKSPLRRIGEPEGLRREAEFARAGVAEKKGPIGANHNQILSAVVIHVRE